MTSEPGQSKTWTSANRCRPRVDAEPEQVVRRLLLILAAPDAGSTRLASTLLLDWMTTAEVAARVDPASADRPQADATLTARRRVGRKQEDEFEVASTAIR